jgi:hypothetical protein
LDLDRREERILERILEFAGLGIFGLFSAEAKYAKVRRIASAQSGMVLKLDLAFRQKYRFLLKWTAAGNRHVAR